MPASLNIIIRLRGVCSTVQYLGPVLQNPALGIQLVASGVNSCNTERRLKADVSLKLTAL